MTERLHVADYVQKNQAISSNEAEEIYNTIHKILDDNETVVLDFSEISLLISSFLNAAIGRLYGEFDPGLIEKSVSYDNMDSRDEYILQRVIERAKDYYKNKELIDGVFNGA